MHIKIIIFFIIKATYCSEGIFNDLNNILFIGMTRNVLEFSFKNDNETGIFYQLSNYAISKLEKKEFWYNIYSFFYSRITTPYVCLKQGDVEERSYMKCSVYNQSQGICFIYAPHCGDLASCIRRANSGADKDDLLKLLDASYEVQKLLPPHTENFVKMCHSVNLRYEIAPLINKFYNNTYNIYTFDSYKNYFQEVLQQATIFYSISVLKNLFLLFLLTNHMSNMFLTYSLYGTISFLIFLDIMNLGIHVDVKVGICNFITVLFLFLLHENMLNYKICYYAKVLCTYWVLQESFFLIKLYFKYDTFKKNMNDFERVFKIPLLLKDQRAKLTVLL